MKTLNVIYVYDALCGWCYGFSPVIKKFYKKFRSRLDFEVISGGMVTGQRVGPIGEVAGYIKQAYKVVEDHTGVKFGAAFLSALEEGQMIFSSIPPSRALTAFKQFRPGDAVLMAHEIQQLIYYHGHPPMDPQGYIDLAEKFQLPPVSFREKLMGREAEQLTQQEFARSSQLKVRGFPAVFLNKGEEYLPIAEGYMAYEDLLMNAINGAAYFEEELMT